MADCGLLFTENEHFGLVDALPYIDTQLGSAEVAQQVKGLIEEEMRHFEPRDYLASLPPPELPLLLGEAMRQEMARIDAGASLAGIDTERYKIEQPTGNGLQDHGAWRKSAENVQMQLEYNRLRLTNLEMLERWGNKAWVAHSIMLRASERVLANEVVALRATREEVNKKRKLDQVSCGNELRKLSRELEQYQQDNMQAERAVQQLEAEVQRLKCVALERGVPLGEDATLARETGDAPPARS